MFEAFFPPLTKGQKHYLCKVNVKICISAAPGVTPTWKYRWGKMIRNKTFNS